MPLSNKDFDSQHVWHPYDSPVNSADTFLISHAEGVHLNLQEGGKLIDAMSSWWCAIHGYNHPHINSALKDQIDRMSHVMFGGLSHEPAIQLAKTLLALKKGKFDQVFFADSGSIAVEVAMKMAMQYQYSIGQKSRQKFLTIRSGYHGDTWRAMSVSDPETGMHHLFKGALPIEFYVSQPPIAFHQEWIEDEDMNGIGELKKALETNHQQIAAFILEPVVQGAGGMYFYHPEYLNQCRQICDDYEVLLIFDEIATGFGRTGEIFASDFTHVDADIICVGKALTGGYLSLAATLATERIAKGIASCEPGIMMHGPTFMGNPLACTAANASLELLSSGNWLHQVKQIEIQFNNDLIEAQRFPNVANIRCLGAIGVIEMNHVVSANQAHGYCQDLGVWLRPFGKCIYAMPPYIIQPDELSQVTHAMKYLAKIL